MPRVFCLPEDGCHNFFHCQILCKHISNQYFILIQPFEYSLGPDVHNWKFQKVLSFIFSDDELVGDENVNSLDPSLVVLTVTESANGNQQSVSTVSRKGSAASADSDPQALRITSNDLK